MPTRDEALGAHLTSIRERHIAAACTAAGDWLTETKIDGVWGERRWLDIFAVPKDITADDVRDHRRAWQISRFFGRLPYGDIADVLRGHLAEPPVDLALIPEIALHVEGLAREIGRATDPANPKRHVSWASKFLTHARPSTRIFIYDQHAGRAVRFWVRQNVPRKQRRSWGASGSYAAYAFACDAMLSQMVAENLFTAALTSVLDRIKVLPSSTGRLADPEFRAGIGDFVARRLLDKFLFHQGMAIQAWGEQNPSARHTGGLRAAHPRPT